MPADATPRKGRAGRLSAPLRGVPAAAGQRASVKVLKQEILMHIATNRSDWSDDRIAKLRRLWDEGLPAAEIGRRLGTTKNAVIGKAWRLELPPRRVSDSPNPVPSLAEIMPLATDRCHWPFGKPGTAGFRFCNQPVLAGKPCLAAQGRRRQRVVGIDYTALRSTVLI
jgi:GcrA cell cycle regulator